MTISSTNTKNSYSGDGSTVAFSYTFKILDDDDITVILRTNATGAETVQTKTTHYSVSGVGNAGGGTITFVSAPATTVTVVLLRNVPLTQTTDYTPNDPFPAATHEDALDKLTLMAQDTQEEVDRSIKLSRTNTMTSTEFTVGATDRANKVFAFDSSGELAVTQEIGTFQGDWAASTAYAERDLVKDTSTNNIFIVNSAHTSSGSQPLTTNANASKYDLIVDAASATTSATNAATSATAAATSATAAANSATAAATSESNAAASEASVSADATAAAASAASASTSATNASTSETNASNSASAAATSATNAATSATSASNSASAAGTSETNAATSATTATTQAAAASTSATNAATSETNAATSETNAATSASSAASDASAAATSAASAAASFDAFDDIYLGAKASAPTVDNDGDALTNGDLYFDTGDNELYIWNGSAWQAASPNIVADTTPQLGGNLDINGNNITGTGNINNTGTITTDGLTVDGAATITTTGSEELNLELVSTNSDANKGPVISFHRNSGSPSNSDTLAELNFNGENNASEKIDYVDMFASSHNVADGSEEGGLTIRSMVGGSLRSRINMYGSTTVFNDDSQDIDFKVESNNNANMLVVDAGNDRVGIGTDAPTEDLHIKGQAGAHADVIIQAHVGYNSGLNFNDNVGMAGRVYYNHSNNFMAFDVNGSEAVRIDSSGNLQLGKTASGIGTNGITLFGDGAIGAADFTRDGGRTLALNRKTSDGDIVEFRKDGSTVGTIGTRSGNLQIGTDDVGFEFHDTDNTIYPANVTTQALPDGTISFGSAASRFKDLYLSGTAFLSGQSSISGNTASAGSLGITSGHSSSPIRFYTGEYGVSAAERMRIDTSGNLLVGKTANNNTTAGGSIRAGESSFVADGSRTVLFNRLSSDGGIVEFRKDGSTVGSIGTNGGRPFFKNPTYGGLKVGTGYSVDPANNSTGAGWDNALDLGAGGTRWKDLYLSGGVYLGGTGSANKLDDYEEGLHVTTATPSTSGTITLNSSADTMAYTKIGRLVLITGEISISSVSSPVGTVVDFTVPFACSSLSEQAERAGGGVFWTENGVGYHVIPFLTFSGSIIRIFKDASAFSANDSITFGVSYLTDS